MVAGGDSYANTVYAITVAHTVAVVGAILLFVVMGFRALGGQFGPRNAEFVQAAALFWHFVAAMGAVIWFLVWFLEGGPRG
jgi:heme/copper-type cytochrome/quinol oxidase subunit 3